MKSTPATGTVAIIVEHNLDTGEISAVRIIANRSDQEQAALELARQITKPGSRSWWRKLLGRAHE